MDPNNNPAPLVALCPRCFCPIDLRRTYNVDVCLPARPPLPQGPPANLPPAGQHPTTDPPVYSSQPPAPQQDNAPAPPQQDNTPAPPPEPSGRSPPQEHKRDRVTHGENRRSSASSSSSFDSAFTQFSYNAEFIDELQAIEDMHFSKTSFKPSSSQRPPLSWQPPPSSSQPPPPSSQPTPPSSPSTESSLTLTSVVTSSHSTESSLTPSAPGESPSPVRRWVVFRGRVPGLYTSSAEATSQTDGFPGAFMLAFDDPAAANTAYEQFQQSGVVPAHGRGPWVVFIGRQPGVFTTYEELRASVVGFSNNCYRCCESVEEGTRALNSFMAKQTVIIPTAQTTPGLGQVGHLSNTVNAAAAADDSWWCCFAGAEPGVYKGLAHLVQAAPAIGGVRRVNSEGEGWDLWTSYFANDEICVVPRA